VNSTENLPRLAGIRLHPIKSLDPFSVNEARIGPNGGLELDRVWALFSADGKWINGKRAPAIHLIRATYKPDLSSVGLSAPEDHRGIEPIRVKFPDENDRAAKWFTEYFEQPVVVRYAREGFPDDGLASGPTIVSTASLQAVCDWFAGITLNEARERFRATLEIDGVPSFWEDQLFGRDENYVIRFKIGGVTFEGSNPCARCPVPPRNPRTGEDWIGFSKLFSELRRATLPPWAPAERFDHFYRLSTNTRVPSTEQGKLLLLGNLVALS
jgi:uncharacterized protein YcbX